MHDVHPEIFVTHMPEERRPAPIQPDWIISGNPVAQYLPVHRSTDGLASLLVWDCSPGEFMWHYDRDETILVLSGAAILQQDGNRERRIGPGDLVVFPAGSSVRWTVTEHFRKVAMLRRVMPPALLRVVNLLRRIKNRGQVEQEAPFGSSLQAGSVSRA